MDVWLVQSLHPNNVSLVAHAASELARKSPFEPLDSLSAEAYVQRELAAATIAALPVTARPMSLSDLQAINEQAAKSAARVLLFGETPRDRSHLVHAAHETTRHARLAKTDDASTNLVEERKLRQEEEFVVRRAAREAGVAFSAAKQSENRM